MLHASSAITYFRMLCASFAITHDTQKQPSSECSVLHLQSHMTHETVHFRLLRASSAITHDTQKQPTSECSVLHLQSHMTHRNSLLQNALCFIWNHTWHTETAHFRKLCASSAITHDTETAHFRMLCASSAITHDTQKQLTSECSLLHLQSHMTHRNSPFQHVLLFHLQSDVTDIVSESSKPTHNQTLARSRPGSIHNGSANWDDCEQTLMGELLVSLFPWGHMHRSGVQNPREKGNPQSCCAWSICTQHFPCTDT